MTWLLKLAEVKIFTRCQLENKPERTKICSKFPDKFLKFREEICNKREDSRSK